MKKRTKIIGLVALFIMTIGFIMKQLLLTGAAFTWALGALTAIFGFALFLTLDRFSYEKSSQGKITSIIGYLGASAFIGGLGFKVLHWPIANEAMILGGLVLLIHFLMSNTVRNQDKLS